MISLQIVTTRSGLLWPTEHWKCLIDALFMKGSNADPRTKYRDLLNLNDLVQDRSGRFLPVDGLISSKCDDTQLRLIHVHRGTSENGGVSIFNTSDLPDTKSWFVVEVPCFGTIGDRKSELQIADNRNTVQQIWPSDWPQSDHLSLEFRLSSDRSDRDIDNLADGIMPFFSGKFPNLQALRMFKSTHNGSDSESLRISSEPFNTNLTQHVRTI
jgi:hypothetical protein